MDIFHRAIEWISIAISVSGVIIVLWGTVEAVVMFFRMKTVRFRRTNLHENVVLRRELGSHLLLGLEVFIAADIINSVASPTWEKVGLLGALVGIRTVLSYFLSIEMRGSEEAGRSSENGGGHG
jgi:uncharacterized membrane protein